MHLQKLIELSILVYIFISPKKW